MSELSNMMALLNKLEKINELERKIAELSKRIEQLENLKTEQVAKQVVDGNMRDENGKSFDVADLAIYEYNTQPPKIGAPRIIIRG